MTTHYIWCEKGGGNFPPLKVGVIFPLNMVGLWRQPCYTIFGGTFPLFFLQCSLAILVGASILMLPMLELAAERAQLTTMYYTNHWHVHPRHVTFSHTHLLPSLNNVLPAMVLQNRVAWSNIKCLSYTSSHSSVRHVSHNPAPTSLGRRLVGAVVLLLLLMSGDIEMNPGPVGECTPL